MDNSAKENLSGIQANSNKANNKTGDTISTSHWHIDGKAGSIIAEDLNKDHQFAGIARALHSDTQIELQTSSNCSQNKHVIYPILSGTWHHCYPTTEC